MNYVPKQEKIKVMAGLYRLYMVNGETFDFLIKPSHATQYYFFKRKWPFFWRGDFLFKPPIYTRHDCSIRYHLSGNSFIGSCNPKHVIRYDLLSEQEIEIGVDHEPSFYPGW